MGKKMKFAGHGMHEFYMSITGKGQQGKRNRKRCRFYNNDGWCMKIFNKCVGPVLCGKYVEVEIKKNSLIGLKIQSDFYGEGTVVSDDGDICKIQYKEKNIQCKRESLVESLKNRI